MNTFFGKAATYDVNKSRYYYDVDTEEYENSLKKAIKDAKKKGYKDKADDLIKELKEFRIERK